jgi:beta-glucosidase/6-phospho-beta-glucosidase/beta-galactosidase
LNSIQLWCTINEPEVYVDGSCFIDVFPPSHKSQPNEASLVLQHLLQSHIEIYDEIKTIDHQPEQYSVGIVKGRFQFDPLDI